MNKENKLSTTPLTDFAESEHGDVDERYDAVVALARDLEQKHYSTLNRLCAMEGMVEELIDDAEKDYQDIQALSGCLSNCAKLVGSLK